VCPTMLKQTIFTSLGGLQTNNKSEIEQLQRERLYFNSMKQFSQYHKGQLAMNACTYT
jgi:hypothetical protein